MRVHARLSAALATLAAAPALAQNDASARLDPIVVEALRAGTPLAEAGTSVAVVTEEEIERRGYDFVDQALADIPGVTVAQRGGPGSVTGIRIRGISPDRVLVLIDGVPVNDAAAPGGAFDFANVLTDDVARIEVLRGPQSTLWGSDAIGGVVNIVTKRPEPGFSAGGYGEFGSFQTRAGGGSVGWGGEAADLRLSVSRYDTEGFSRAASGSEADGYDNTTLAGRGGLDLPGGARIEAIARYAEARIEGDGFPPPNFTLADTDSVTDAEEGSGAVSVSLPLLDGRLLNEVTAGASFVDRETYDSGALSFESFGRRLFARYQGDVAVDDVNDIVFGVDGEQLSAVGDETSLVGVFALWETRPVEDLTLSFGLRRDEHGDFGGVTTGRAALALAASETLTFRASVGTGFSAPTLFQLTFADAFSGRPANPDLDPERSVGFDLGFDLDTPDGRGRLSVTAFRQTVDDQIAFVSAPAPFPYINLDETRTQGVEVGASYALTDTLEVTGVWTWLDAEDVGADSRLLLTPRHAGQAALAYDDGFLSGAVVLRYNGEERDFGDATLDPWTRMDLSGAVAVTENVEVYGRVENLFDADYEQAAGFGTAGRSGFLGLRARF